ncbi:hypothetical protein dsx2_1003 [Desulfovibrio sp. X2]|uniref:hypothetical protein n=1 Tax=Desulfovibrio sp. X2 TaxID=941449 RepID=UPI000358D1B6|nr:hypothetical protein [Desulfovibrio sp. X2]EPR37060.1 hypothetical protein dsx2_1003 [Desulfovibrio sp. X2]
MTEYTLTDRESALLGQDFLTWLWYAGEARGGLFKTAEGAHFTCYMEQRVAVQGGEGDSKETAVVSGAHARLSEAKAGLRRGKKVNKAMLRFDQDGESWTLQLKSEDFALNSVKPPKTEKAGEDEDADGAFLEKMYLYEKCVEFFDAIYKEFLALRLSATKWPEELEAFRVWLSKEDE